MKRGYIFIFIVIACLIIPLISAGFFSNWWGKITGEATAGSASLNITIGNSAPTIPYVQAISSQNPLESGYRSVLLNFSVNDTDGASNINLSSARVEFNKTGETTRTTIVGPTIGLVVAAQAIRCI